MKRIASILSLAAAWAGMGNAQYTARVVPVFVVRGPTIVAFSSPATKMELESSPDTSDVMNDFRSYNVAAHESLLKSGIEFHEADGHSFKTRIGKRIQTFRTDEIGVGYYLVAPGKRPRVKTGVMTNSDLLAAARKYFGNRIP